MTEDTREGDSEAQRGAEPSIAESVEHGRCQSVLIHHFPAGDPTLRWKAMTAPELDAMTPDRMRATFGEVVSARSCQLVLGHVEVDHRRENFTWKTPTPPVMLPFNVYNRKHRFVDELSLTPHAYHVLHDLGLRMDPVLHTNDEVAQWLDGLGQEHA